MSDDDASSNPQQCTKMSELPSPLLSIPIICKVCRYYPSLDFTDLLTTAPFVCNAWADACHNHTAIPFERLFLDPPPLLSNIVFKNSTLMLRACNRGMDWVVRGLFLAQRESQQQQQQHEMLMEDDGGVMSKQNAPGGTLASRGGGVEAANRLAAQNAMRLKRSMFNKWGTSSQVRRETSLASLVDCVDVTGQTPLMLAAQKGYGVIADFLISKEFGNANLSKTDRHGSAAIHHAAWSGQPALVAQLIKAGADPTQRDEVGATPLHLIASNIAPTPSHSKKNKNATSFASSRQQQQPVSLATRCEIAKILIRNEPRGGGVVCLNARAQQSTVMAVVGVVGGTSVDRRTKWPTPLHCAIIRCLPGGEDNSAMIVRFLVEETRHVLLPKVDPKEDETEEERRNLRLQQNRRLVDFDCLGPTTTSSSPSSSKPPTTTAVTAGGGGAHEANAKSACREEYTLLQVAVLCDNFPAAKVLIELGADIHSKSASDQDTALDLALRYDRSEKWVKLLSD